jgi:hypothetical protein
LTLVLTKVELAVPGLFWVVIGRRPESHCRLARSCPPSEWERENDAVGEQNTAGWYEYPEGPS